MHYLQNSRKYYYSFIIQIKSIHIFNTHSAKEEGIQLFDVCSTEEDDILCEQKSIHIFNMRSTEEEDIQLFDACSIDEEDISCR